MFEYFPIPQTIEECSETFNRLYPIMQKLSDVVPGIRLGSFIWHANNGFDTMARIIHSMTAAGLPEQSCYSIRYFVNQNYRMIDIASESERDVFGIVINEEASTHYRELDYAGATHLVGAEDLIKQSPQHFVKLFTMPENHKLYVYTNKMLEPPALYKLFSLNISLINKECLEKNVLAANFIKALPEKDSEKTLKILNDFLNSDAVTEFEYKKLEKILKNKNESKIRQLERTIQQNRTNIADYENIIANLAVEIRENNKKLDFLRSVTDDEDHRLFYRYLKRHPYIVNFTPCNDGHIELNYRAPIVYYNTTPAEKYINRAEYTPETKTIIKMIIGGKYELWTKCRLNFDTASFNVTAFTLNRDDDLLNHPHIDRFHCFGNHRQAIQESAEAGDYIGAIEQLSQAVLNLNFYDSCVITEMISNIKSRWFTLVTWKCKETGEYLTTSEVVERGDYYEEA